MALRLHGARGSETVAGGLGKVVASVLASLSLLAPVAVPLPAQALFEDPLANVKLEPQKNGFIPRMADVGVREFLVKDGRQLLRLALPTSSEQRFLAATRSSGDPARKITDDLELIRVRLEQVGNKNKPAWSACLGDVSDISNVLKKERQGLLDKSADAAAARALLDDKFTPLLTELAAAVRVEDVKETLRLQSDAADAFAAYSAARLPKAQLPYAITEEFKALPRLQGRAVVEMTLKKKGGALFKSPELVTSDAAVLTLVVDGFTHPLTAGNFVDLGECV